MSSTPFFIGFAAPPREMRGFLLGAAALLVALFAGLGWLLAATQDDPGDGAFRFDWGRQTVTGVLEAGPHPLLHVTIGTENVPAGRTIMLSGIGKRGVQDRADPLDGTLVTAAGIVIARGDLLMLQLAGGTDGLAPAEGTASPPVPVPLGRWRLTGEICDGKCYAGAMRPGTGLAHRACANLCLTGGVPAVFVATGPVEGTAFLMLGDPDGGPATEAAMAHAGLLVSAEGEIERRGDLLVFLVDPATIRRAE